MGAFVAPPGDIGGKMIFLRGRFALCPRVFLKLISDIFGLSRCQAKVNHPAVRKDIGYLLSADTNSGGTSQ